MTGEVFAARGREFSLERTLILGILNVTSDSFSDGGDYLDPDKALARAAQMEEEGADILDVGGQSTRPGYTLLSPQEEWSRLEPVLPRLVERTRCAVSVDTFYPEVARKALAAGAHILNDVTGFGDEMMALAAESGCGCIVMCPTGGDGEDVIERTRQFFLERVAAAEKRGIPRERLVLDPGVGFGTTREEDVKLLARARDLKVPGCGLMIAASRKRVTALGNDAAPKDRLAATLVAHTAAVLQGAQLLRVHDVKEAVQAARMAERIREVELYG